METQIWKSHASGAKLILLPKSEYRSKWGHYLLLPQGKQTTKKTSIILFQAGRQRYMLTKARIRHWEWVQLVHTKCTQQLLTTAVSSVPWNNSSHQSQRHQIRMNAAEHSSLPHAKEDVLPKTIPTSASTRDAEVMHNMRYPSIFKMPAWLTETYWQHTVHPLFTAAAGVFQHPGQSAQAYSSTVTLPLDKYTKCLQTAAMCCNAWSWRQDLQVPTSGLSHLLSFCTAMCSPSPNCWIKLTPYQSLTCSC